MSIPNPQEAPQEFEAYLKSLKLEIAIPAFLHNQNCPVPGPNGRLDEGSAQNWCERMDTILVNLINHSFHTETNYS
jgi:hypothetical protein